MAKLVFDRIDFLSLVDKPAHGEKFYITKRDDSDNTEDTTTMSENANKSDVSDLELESAVFDAAPIFGMSAKEFLTALQQVPDLDYSGSPELFGESVQKSSDGSFTREANLQRVNRRRVMKGEDPISEEELNARSSSAFVADAVKKDRKRVQKSALWGNDSFVADAVGAEQEAETNTERTSKRTSGERKGRANPGNPDGNASSDSSTSFVADALE